MTDPATNTVEDTPATISVEEAAARLGIGRQLAYRLARSAELPGVLRLGSRYRVSVARLDAALGQAPASEAD